MKPKKLRYFLSLTLAVAMACDLVTDASGQAYTIVDLGIGEAAGINQAGDVVGSAGSGWMRAFLYSRGRKDLLPLFPGTPGSYGYGINDAGQITGAACVTSGCNQHAFLYSGGTMYDLGTLDGSPDDSFGYAINNLGQVVGFSDDSLGSHAFLWTNGLDTVSGHMLNIDTLGSHESWAAAINDGGQVCGTVTIDSELGSEYHAFLYSDGIMEDLGTFPVPVGNLPHSEAMGINNNGDVVGYSSGVTASHAFLYTRGLGMQDIDGRFRFSSAANAINDKGQIVGRYGQEFPEPGGALSAFIYTDGHMTNLNFLIPTNSGWNLQRASGINNAGQICGWGYFQGGRPRGFLLNPRTIPTITTFYPEPNHEREVPADIRPCVTRKSDFFEFQASYSNKLLLRIQADPSTELRVHVEPQDKTGGHNHGAVPRLHGWLRRSSEALQNFPKTHDKADWVDGGTREYSSFDQGFRVRTDEHGQTNVYYVAPEIAGFEDVVVTVDDQNPAGRSFGTQRIQIAFPDFVRLGIDDNIEEIGSLAQHPNNHNGTADLVEALRVLALNYAAEYNETFFSPSPQLPVNDMSLPLGGTFDLNRSWTTPGGHIGHREGIEVDVGGATQGHGLVPTNLVFEALIMEQGWWIANQKLWYSEKNKTTGVLDHYHLTLSGGRGKVSPTLTVQATNWDMSSHVLTLRFLVENRGGLDADFVSFEITSFPEQELRTLEPRLPGLRIREPELLEVEFAVSNHVRAFTVRVCPFATSANRFGQVFSPPADFPISYIFIQTPEALNLPHELAANLTLREARADAIVLPQWNCVITNSPQSAAVGGTTVFSGQIRNETGSELLLTSASVDLQTLAPKGSYVCELAQEVQETGGIIPAAGYEGPLVVLRWLSAPPIGSVTTGTLKIVATTGVNPTFSAVDFSSPFLLQKLDISRIGDTAVVSWSVEAAGFILQAATTLDESEWVNVDAPVIQVNEQNTVTITNVSEMAFFQLRGP